MHQKYEQRKRACPIREWRSRDHISQVEKKDRAGRGTLGQDSRIDGGQVGEMACNSIETWTENTQEPSP